MRIYRLSIITVVLAELLVITLPSFAAAKDEFDEAAEKYQQDKRVKGAGDQTKAKWTFEDVEEPSVATTVFSKVSKSVVIVEAQTPRGRVQGSGVVYDITPFALEDPHPLADVNTTPGFSLIVTNAHVVKNAGRVSVTHEKKQYKASVEYIDDAFDLAFLCIGGVVLSDSVASPGADVRVGQKVFAVGSPLGFENTISEGIISGVREQDGVTFLQTTAPISAGSSGGGLFDSKGGLVGITTFKLKGGENLNFAVDIERIAEFSLSRFPIDELRYAASISLPALSPAQMGAVNSHRFVEWFLKARGENGEKLYVRLGQQLEAVKGLKGDSSAFHARVEPIVNECTQILNRFFKEQGSKAAVTQDTPDIALLVCSLAPSPRLPEYRGERMDLTLRLDYTNKTVNGRAANFTETEIEWGGVLKSGTEIRLLLNRYSCFIQVRAKGLDIPLFSGQCSPAGERKF